EETSYFIHRLHGNWKTVSIILFLVKFVIPFFLLLPAPIKRRENYLLGVALLLLGAQWLDCYWMIGPVFSPKTPRIGFMEIGLAIGFLGLFGLAFSALLQRTFPFPKKDPKFLDGVNFHQ
ncbi:MAG: hypothetical protein Q7S00_01365, partial [bacterium]|nr:hypothetical protein [bacterium]